MGGDKTRWAKRMKSEAKRRVLSDGQGARKKKAVHRRTRSNAHKRSINVGSHG